MRAEAAIATTTNRSEIVGALQRAATATGADFGYLLGTAIRESGLKPTAKAGTSSASGLFQFVDQTWLGMVKNYGAKYGLSSYANAITQGSDGRYKVADPADRKAILALRNDPEVSSLMAGEFAQASRATLAGSLGRDVCGGELYAAHFMGPDAACRLIKLSETKPDASAASAFPAAAGANRNVFYHRDGTAKTVREVYDWTLKHANGTLDGVVPAKTDTAAAPTVVASANTAGLSDNSDLLSSMTSWRPRHGFFGSDFSANEGSVPSTPFLLTPGVMDVLSSMSPVADGAATH
jgi:hypothetical protein